MDAKKDNVLYPSFVPAETYPSNLSAPPNPSYSGQQYQTNTANYVTYPPPQNVPSDEGCFAGNQKNKPQSNSVGSGSLVLMSGGMNMVFALNLFTVRTTHMAVSWYVGVVIGLLLGAPLCNLIKKKFINMVSACLVILGGILFMSMSTNYDALLAGRYINGIANGFVFISTLVLAGEEAVKENRGWLAASVESMSFASGILIQQCISSIYGYSLYSSFDAQQTHGTLCLVYGVVSLVLSFYLVVESPVNYLVQNQEEQALDSLRRLQRPFVVTTQTYDWLNETKLYVTENKRMTVGESAVAGLPALMKLCVYRGMNALTCSWVTVLTLAVCSMTSFTYDVWPYIMFGVMRMLGALIGAFCMDGAGRKKIMLIFGVLCGGMAIGIGIIFDDLRNIYIALYLLFAMQLFSGFFICPSSSYLSEAFPLVVKPYFIAFAFLVEMLVQIIVATVEIDVYSISEYHFTVGALFFVFFVFGLLCLPETKQTTLREALAKFRSFKSMGVN